MSQPTIGLTSPRERGQPGHPPWRAVAAPASTTLPARHPTQQTTGADANSAPLSLPDVTLPSGGGAIRAVDEKLIVTLASGSAGFALPIATTSCRVFQPPPRAACRAGRNPMIKQAMVLKECTP